MGKHHPWYVTSGDFVGYEALSYSEELLQLSHGVTIMDSDGGIWNMFTEFEMRLCGLDLRDEL